jgi:DNA-directed RNA polymerase specialized sigma24 family protein
MLIKMYDKAIFDKKADLREFEAFLYSTTEKVAKARYNTHRRTAGWTYDDFLGEGLFIALRYSKKTQKLYLEKSKEDAIRYLYKCVQYKLNSYAFKENVYKSHNIPLLETIQFQDIETFLGYAEIETQFVNKTELAKIMLDEVGNQKEKETLTLLYWESQTPKNIAKLLSISERSVSDRKKSVFDKIVLLSTY